MAVEKEQAKPSEESKPSAEADMGRKAPGTAPAPSWFTPKRYFLVLGGFLFFCGIFAAEEKRKKLFGCLYFCFLNFFLGFCNERSWYSSFNFFSFFVYWFLRKCRI